ncbi:hypothetical protein INR49_012850 [Caranx melampygus]|nr:hypothetical protein INR49_012850 [Caranx melampygus]
MGDDHKWYSDQCSSEHEAICLAGNKMIYHTEKLSWHSASQICQDKEGSLATITENTEYVHSGWIGLYQQADLQWDWIGDLKSNYRNWAPGEPLTADCGAMNSSTALWHTKKCSENLRFVCFSDNLVLVKENKTWEQALNYCRNFCTYAYGSCNQQYNLLSLPILSEHSYARQRIYNATTDEVWLGLRFLGGHWWWENGDWLYDEGTLPKCSSDLNYCGVLSKNDTKMWITRDCSERRNFVCYSVPE